ncbi:DUF4255 domain-containing protein [Pseudochryseolinea flava]|uniref:Pvc16 N-terminal domain-containing protein n=1 Tax=Pseudochryseolinea flava TaxID=2059302 RepID=A0A364Y411_9BACT|nr:DUF4255 domain-containing protein [Pseudochryseolinea flava]RAW01597.1 hypothetical protein DQQ10_08030 [Pseudochryseolinea flava]
MVDQALNFLSSELNVFIGNKDYHYRGLEVAMVSDLVDEKGELTFKKRMNATTTGDFLIITLINVEEEVIGKSQLPYLKHPNQSFDVLNPEVKVNLYMLVTAVSTKAETERYTNALKVLSYAIGFFQYKNVFDRVNSPVLPEGIGKLIVELVSPTFEQQNHIWGGMGAKYMPSVLYKIRLLTYRERMETSGAATVRKIKATINGN